MWVRALFAQGLLQVELASSKGFWPRSFILQFLTLLKFFPTRFLLVPRQTPSSLPKDTVLSPIHQGSCISPFTPPPIKRYTTIPTQSSKRISRKHDSACTYPRSFLPVLYLLSICHPSHRYPHSSAPSLEQTGLSSTFFLCSVLVWLPSVWC